MMARPKTPPPSSKAQFLLPDDLIERIRENAARKAGNNQSFLVREILEGRMTLDDAEPRQ